MKALGIFEGGGVRGYAHIGALKACDDRGIEFEGIAGTSIGAIVAVLVAAGYTSDDLYAVDDDGRETGLFACDVETEFLDAKEYAHLAAPANCTPVSRTSRPPSVRIRSPEPGSGACARASDRGIRRRGTTTWDTRSA